MRRRIRRSDVVGARSGGPASASASGRTAGQPAPRRRAPTTVRVQRESTSVVDEQHRPSGTVRDREGVADVGELLGAVLHRPLRRRVGAPARRRPAPAGRGPSPSRPARSATGFGRRRGRDPGDPGRRRCRAPGGGDERGERRRPARRRSAGRPRGRCGRARPSRRRPNGTARGPVLDAGGPLAMRLPSGHCLRGSISRGCDRRKPRALRSSTGSTSAGRSAEAPSPAAAVQRSQMPHGRGVGSSSSRWRKAMRQPVGARA